MYQISLLYINWLIDLIVEAYVSHFTDLDEANQLVPTSHCCLQHVVAYVFSLQHHNLQIIL